MKQQLISIACLLLATVFFEQITQTIAQYSNNEAYYDPEIQDGIPVLRSTKGLAPGVRWSPAPAEGGENFADDQQDFDDDIRRVVSPPTQKPRARAIKAATLSGTTRRNSYIDPEDGLDEDDDEDRDEYQSRGSRNHDRYTENPAFGESRKAAKDGEDIESFFDKHLGPQDAIEGVGSGKRLASLSSELNSAVDKPIDSDEGDQYEAAASSPLASIFHSLLNLHKRPLVITTSSADDSPTTTTAASGNNNSASSSSSSNNSKENQLSSSSVSSAAVSNLIGASSPAIVAPLAYLAPFGSASSVSAYESALDSAGNPPTTDGSGSENPIREIYIARRPSAARFANHYQTYTPVTNDKYYHNHRHAQASSAYLRGTPMATGGPVYDEQNSDDYSRYPVAASYLYQREPQASTSGPAEDEDDSEQTVSYGLSFGSPSEATNEDQEKELNNDADVGATAAAAGGDDEPAAGANNYHTRHRHHTHSNSLQPTRAYNNYHYPAIATSPGYSRVKTASMMQQLQQSPFNGARYHKDPTEDVQFGQFSRNHQFHSPASATSGSNKWQLNRQQLLANLDNQLKTSPYYQAQQQQQLMMMMMAGANRGDQSGANFRSPDKIYIQQQPSTNRKRPVKKSNNSRQKQHATAANTHLDTYSSYDNEVDPYKAYTTASRIVSEPSIDSTVQSGSNRVQSNMDSSSSASNTTNHSGAQDKQQISNDGTIVAQIENSIAKTNGDLLRNNNINNSNSNKLDSIKGQNNNQQKQQADLGLKNSRVRREDSDVGEDVDNDDDGVWVDDDEDDDSKQQSSDLNETSQDPEEEDNQQDAATSRAVHPSSSTEVAIGGPHSYELSPDDLMVYNG